MKFQVLLVLLIFSNSSFVNGQAYKWRLHFENYSIGVGLPSQEAYDVVTDDSGFLYISTDRGIVRFDGKQFVPVRFASYQKDYTLFKFTKDARGRIWCSSYDQGLYFVKDNKLHPYKYNDTLNKFRASDILEDFFIDTDGSIYFYLRKFGNSIGKIDSGGRFYYVATPDENKNTYYGFFHAEKIIPLFTSTDNIHRTANTVCSPNIKPIRNISSLPGFSNVRKARGQRTSMGEFVTAGNVLAVTYAGENTLNYQNFPNEILCFEIVDTSLWIGTRGGIYYFPSLFDLRKYDMYFPGLGFNGICRDHQNGLWFASLQQGIFYLSPRQVGILNYPVHINDFFIEKDTLLTSHRAGNIFYSSLLRKSDIYTIGTCHDKWTHSTGVLVKKAYPLPGGIVALCLAEGFMLYSHQQQSVYFDSRKEKKFNERVLCIELFRDTLWIGTANGIYIMANGHIAKWQPGTQLLQIKISDIKACGDQTLWIATLGQGLYSYDSVLKLCPEVSVKFIESIYVDDDRDIWVGSNAGIFLKTGQKWFYFASSSGLPSFGIRKIVYKDKDVYGMAGNKLFRFSLDKKRLKALAPYIKLQANIFVDGEKNKAVETGRIILNKDQRHFRLMIDNPNFESSGHSIAYRFAGSDTGWIQGEGNTFALTDLAPGNHTMHVRYTEKITPASPYEFTINLVKEPQWTQTLWFQLLLVVFGGFITIPLGVLIFRGLLEKRRLYYEKILADQRVLSTQLNPHFTYNALNSMQLLLYGKNWNSAMAYNEGLGNVLRRVFRQSEKTFVSLTQELDLVKEYLELEKIRLHRQIDFTLRVDKGSSPDAIPVPPLLIQPLIENAIWHGYKENQQLEIQCVIEEVSGNEVCITISDSGKGFEQSRDKQVHSALKNLFHRIELLNSSRLVYINIEIYSPVRQDGKQGTEIILTIRYLHEKESDHYRR